MTTRSEPRWRVERVEVVSPGLATPLRGRALLLGTGVVAFCSGPGIEVALTVAAVGERLEVTEIRVTGGGLSSTLLRTVPVATLVRLAFASLDDDDWAAQRAVDASARLDEVVAVWRSLQGGSDGHRATQTTARRLSLSRGYVSRLLSRARADGLIPR